jgi:Flp pilus assembly protein TadD
MRLATPLAALILFATPAVAVDPFAPAPELAPARAAIEAQDWPQAIELLRAEASAHPDNPDVLNLLGFASRQAGDLEAAASFYRAALRADPNHLGALEYQGHLFLTLGDRAAAERNLARLQELCGDCEDAQALAAALAGGTPGY